jgi:uncharacterized protein (UPF0548 family)
VTDRLRPDVADRLRSAALTYDEAGASLADLPAGYHHLDETFEVGRGRADFERTGDALMRWGVQRGVRGVAVSASADLVGEREVAIVRLGWGPLAVPAPVRVVAVVEEPERRGFAYGTLPGHPERGEESFVVELRADDTVVLVIRAFSSPGSALARAIGPAGRLAQRMITRRYGRSLR